MTQHKFTNNSQSKQPKTEYEMDNFMSVIKKTPSYESRSQSSSNEICKNKNNENTNVPNMNNPEDDRIKNPPYEDVFFTDKNSPIDDDSGHSYNMNQSKPALDQQAFANFFEHPPTEFETIEFNYQEKNETQNKMFGSKEEKISNSSENILDNTQMRTDLKIDNDLNKQQNMVYTNIISEYSLNLIIDRIFAKEKSQLLNPTSNNTRCPKCQKYWAIKRFTTHLEKCLKK